MSHGEELLEMKNNLLKLLKEEFWKIETIKKDSHTFPYRDRYIKSIKNFNIYFVILKSGKIRSKTFSFLQFCHLLSCSKFLQLNFSNPFVLSKFLTTLVKKFYLNLKLGGKE